MTTSTVLVQVTILIMSHYHNDQKKLMTESNADISQGNEKAAVESVPLATTEFTAEDFVDRVSEPGTGPADENNEKTNNETNAVDAAEVISAGIADSTEMTNQSMETISQDPNVSNTDNH